MRKSKALAGCIAGATLFAGCSTPADEISIGGRVDATTLSVAVPALQAPRVNPDAGFQGGATTGVRPAIAAVARVVAVHAAEGDVVKGGTILVELDATALDAAVAAAQADAGVAAAALPVLDNAIDKTHDAQDTIADKRKQVRDGIAKLNTARADLLSKRAQATKLLPELKTKLASVSKLAPTLQSKLKQVNGIRATILGKLAQAKAGRRLLTTNLAKVDSNLATLRAKRTQLVAQLAQPLPPPVEQQLRAALAQVDAGIAKLTGVRTMLRGKLAQVNAGIAKANSALAKVNAGRAQLLAGIAKLKAGIAQLKAGIAKLTAGLRLMATGLAKIDSLKAKAADGLRKLDDAEQQVLDARATLQGNRRLAVVAGTRARTAVAQARTARAQAVVRAPADGTIVAIAHVGDVLAPGATAATIREHKPVEVTTWLAPTQVARICVGAAASVRGDWMSAGSQDSGKVSVIATAAEYPPTYQGTTQVHLTRAFAVRIRLDEAATLPAGVPVDVHISPCRKG